MTPSKQTIEGQAPFADHKASARYAFELALLTGIYVAVAQGGLAIGAVSGFATLVWPATGIALAALLLFGNRLWPAVFIGAFIANAWQGAPWSVAAVMAVGNTLEAIVGSWLVRRGCGPTCALDRMREVVVLIVGGALLSTMVSATIGVGALYVGGTIDTAAIGPTWRAWWVGDAIGDLVAAPLILTWGFGPRLPPPSWRLVEALCAGAACVLVAVFVFAEQRAFEPAFQQPYLVFAPLLWVSVRFGPRGAATGTFLVTLVAVATTALGDGPFVRLTLSQSLMFLQVFTAFTAITFLVIGAFTAELTSRERDLRTALDSTRVAREHAESASELKTDLLHAVSHELRTPLATLRLQLERLQVEEADTMSGERRALLDRMLLQIGRLHELIEGLLTSARIEAGELTTTVRRFEMGSLADECADEVRLAAETKRLRLSVDVSSDVQLCSDRELVHLIVVNLLANAIKFTDRGSVELKSERTVEGCRIAVTDTGIGIAPHDRHRIFEPFTRLEPVRQKHRAGVGLGLTVVRSLTIALGGHIEVQSELGAGSTFVVTLPDLMAARNANQR